MTKAEIYIEEYKKLEESVRRVYKLTRDQSVIAELKRQPGFEEQKSEIQSCADLRNFFQHNSRIQNEFAAEPSDTVIEFVRELTARVNSRPRCRDICTKKRDIFWRSQGDRVKEAVQFMQEKGFSNIPILRDGRVVGVFDEHAFFCYAAGTAGNVFGADDGLTFRDLDAYISVSERDMRAFAFLSMNAYVDDAAEIFEKKLPNGKRASLILLTNSGKPNDRLQGILAPWDVIANS